VPLVLKTDTQPGTSTWAELSSISPLGDVRPTADDGTVPSTVYVDSATGNDATGDGTLGNPYATLERAFMVCPAAPRVSRTIRLQGAGPYNFGAAHTANLNFITVQGDDPIVSTTRTITSIGSSSQANGLVLTDAGVAMGVDEYRGRLVLFTSGPLNGTYGTVATNTANTVSVISGRSASTYALPAIGNTYQILEWVTVLDFPFLPNGSVVFESSAGSTFLSLKIAQAGAFLFCNDTDKIDFTRCRIEIDGLICGRGGGIFLTTCSVANVGSTFSDWGMLSALTNSTILLKNGTLIDAQRATSSTRKFISCLSMGTYESQGEIGFRDLSTKGILVRGGVVTRLQARLGTLFHTWRFFACSAALQINTSSEGWGWAPLDLPALHGTITGNYAVSATGGAHVRLGSTSALVTATVPNAVSANGGTSAVSRATDDTIIVNGTPSYQEYTPSTPANWAGAAPTTIAAALDRLAAANPGA
jgi:hypothetical protein